MKVFRDNKNRDWTVSITVGTIKRVKDTLGINLIDAVGGDLIEKIKSDPIMLCDLLYVICKPEADTKNISDVEFGEGLAGDAIMSATEALLGDLVDFFPSRQREILRKALAKVEDAEARLTQMVAEKIDKEMDSEIQKHLSNFGRQFGQPQEK